MARQSNFYRPQNDFGEETQTRCCDAPGCSKPGEFKAPKSRSNLREYYWFCLDHIRAYNAAWNYFADMDEDQIEKHIRHATIWERPTGKMGVGQNFFRAREKIFENLEKDFGGFKYEHYREKERASGENWYAENNLERSHMDALAIFELDQNTDFQEIKAKYRALVKKHHPDLNGGCKKAEEKLKRINQSFMVLKQVYLVGQSS